MRWGGPERACAEQSRAEQKIAEQNRRAARRADLEQSSAEEGRAEQSRAEQSRAEQSIAHLAPWYSMYTYSASAGARRLDNCKWRGRAASVTVTLHASKVELLQHRSRQRRRQQRTLTLDTLAGLASGLATAGRTPSPHVTTHPAHAATGAAAAAGL